MKTPAMKCPWSKIQSLKFPRSKLLRSKLLQPLGNELLEVASIRYRSITSDELSLSVLKKGDEKLEVCFCNKPHERPIIIIIIMVHQKVSRVLQLSKYLTHFSNSLLKRFKLDDIEFHINNGIIWTSPQRRTVYGSHK